MRKSVILSLAAFLLFSVFNIFLSVDTCNATGNIIYVNASGGANYTTIQEAINAAESGDEIFVYNGDYHENIVITQNLILTGQSKDNTIIDGDKNGHVVYAHGSEGSQIDIRISGFTIKNAGGTGKDCIALSYVNSGEINDNKIMNSDDSDGIQLDHCSGVTLSGNTIADNAHGCGINIVASTNNIIGDNNQIQNNLKGISLTLSSGNILYKNYFSNNGQNAYDDNITNSWSYNSQGNYWDDYTGQDANHDGIGDTPYDIPGVSNKDLYPLGYFGTPVNQKPVAYIDYPVDQSIATYGHSVSFSGRGTDDETVVGYNWRSSRDGQLSTSASFSTSHLSLGNHIIYFKVIDNDGEWSEKSISITITQNQKPTAHISAPSGTVVYGNPVQFSGDGTDPDGQVVAYSWRSVPSGIVSSQKSFTLSNLPVDEYTIYFKVRDDYGDWSQEVSTTLTVRSDTQTDKPPVANASGSYSGYTNEEITFNGTGSYDPDAGDSITYHWNFGDNSTGEGISPKHTYSSEGNYTVELTVIDSHGEQSKNYTYASITTQGNSQNGAGSNSNKGIPGFELILLTIAIIVIMILKQNKKRGFN